MNLNIYQRITLIIGGVLFGIALLTAPCSFYYDGLVRRIECGSSRPDIFVEKDTSSIIFRGLIIWGITIPVFFALSNIKTSKRKNKDDNIFKNNK